MGFVSIVGAGPGAPEYITLKGFQVLQSATVVVYDALLDEAFHSFFPTQAEVIYVGKRCQKHSKTQPEINTLLIQKAQAGHHVVRLKGGDPLVFGRGGEEVMALQQANIPVDIIPGVSALNSVGSLSGIPLTHRGVSAKVMILECHQASLSKHDWKEIAGFQGTLVLFMASKTIQTVAEYLLNHGADENLPVALVENASLPSQQITRARLQEVATHGLSKVTDGPALIYVGDVVALQPLMTGASPIEPPPYERDIVLAHMLERVEQTMGVPVEVVTP